MHPQSFEMRPPAVGEMGRVSDAQWSTCPVTVRLEPMPFFVADWQLANQLRACGEVVSVRFQRSGEGAALVRFHHPAAAANALRCAEFHLLGQRIFIMPAWCESRHHQWAGHCSAPIATPRAGGEQRHGGGEGMQSSFQPGDWCACVETPAETASPPPLHYPLHHPCESSRQKQRMQHPLAFRPPVDPRAAKETRPPTRPTRRGR